MIRGLMFRSRYQLLFILISNLQDPTIHLISSRKKLKVAGTASCHILQTVTDVTNKPLILPYMGDPALVIPDDEPENHIPDALPSPLLFLLYNSYIYIEQ